jgi:hypothetical protein
MTSSAVTSARSAPTAMISAMRAWIPLQQLE